MGVDKMNLQSLFKGQIIHNYKELCALLDIDEKTGNAKVSQFKELEQYFKLTKNGHSFIVEDIYKSPIEKVDGRKLGNRSIYVDDISIQLLDYIVKNKHRAVIFQDSKRLFLTAHEIFLITGMINERYIPTKQSIRAFIEETPGSLDIDDLNEFFKRTEGKMRQILLAALKNLQDGRYAILYETKHRIQDGMKWRLATGKEEEKIMDVKNKIIAEMNLRTSREIYFNGRSFEFHSRVNSKLRSLYGWTGIYSGFLIGYGEQLKPTLKRYKEEFKKLLSFRYSLNGKLASFTNKDAERKYLKSQTEYEKAVEEIHKQAEECWGEPSQVGVEYPEKEYRENWVDNQFFLTDKLIKLPKKLIKK
jgi:hypothetical protein